MITRRKMLLGATAAVTAGATISYSQLRRQRPGEEVIAWLRANAIPLASAEPGTGFNDLDEALRGVVGRARIVGLGEATHGTREFITLKHRMVEYCVTNFGFTMIGLEAAFGEERPINEYVLHGKGSAAEAVGSMLFFIWGYEEMVAIVEWVRAWNLTHERKVTFYCFDMQTTDAATHRLLDYLRPIAPDLAAETEASLKPQVFEKFEALPGPVQEQVLAQVKRILDRFDSEKTSWTSRTTDIEWRLARQSVVVLAQCAGLNQIKEVKDQMEFRGRSMADNVTALLEAEGPHAKALLMAHNYHVKRGTSHHWLFGNDRPDMGCFLRAAFGTEYAVIGFSFNQGRFVAKDADINMKLGEQNVGPAPDHMLDAALAATGVPLFALRLDRVPSHGAVAKWMASSPYQRDIGAVFSQKGNERMGALGLAPFMLAADPRELYDILLFVETTNAPTRLGHSAVGIT